MIVTVEIDELVLHGFEPGMRYALADALQAELVRVISERGLPVARTVTTGDATGRGGVSPPAPDAHVWKHPERSDRRERSRRTPASPAPAQTGRPAALAASVAGVVYDSISAALAGPVGESEMVMTS